LTNDSYNKFLKLKEQFRCITEELSGSLPRLKTLQQKLVNNRAEVSYKVETPVVYNSALDEITRDSEIRLIIVADNPGRREQAAENRRYLTGPSGKIADNFFRNNPALGIDFKKNVIILNKTPIHSPRTNELRELCRMEKGSGNIAAALEESQKKMAWLLVEFHKALMCPVWLTGYSEMRKGGIFETYTETLKNLYSKKEFYKQLFIFRHFSMNQFTIDLKKQSLPDKSIEENLRRIGAMYRQRILLLDIE